MAPLTGSSIASLLVVVLYLVPALWVRVDAEACGRAVALDTDLRVIVAALAELEVSSSLPRVPPAPIVRGQRGGWMTRGALARAEG